MLRRLRRYIRNQVRDYMHPKCEYVLATVQGSDMIIKIDRNHHTNNYTDCLWFDGIYEEETTEYCKNVIVEGDIVADVGANLGYYTLLFSKLVGPTGVVFAFEPNPEIFKILCRNVKLNNCKNVVLINAAVSDCEGQADLYLNQYWHSWASLRPREYTIGRIPVYTVTLDGLDTQFDLVKIDVEGLEYSVLKGMTNILQQDRLRVILEDNHEYTGFNAEGILELLKDFDIHYRDKNLIGEKKRWGI